MIFSQRYHRVLEQNALKVEIPEAARRKLWAWLSANNAQLRIQRDPGDSWISNSSILEEIESELRVENGWDQIPGAPSDDPIRQLFIHGDAAYVFDAIELAGKWMEAEPKEEFRQRINQIFELHTCPWRLSDGEFFKLDSDFIGARIASTAHDALVGNNFSGAAEEYAKARQYLGVGEVREAIYFAGHSFESVMKALTSVDQANADRLIKELLARGYFDDLPESVRAGFVDQVLKALPFLRNKLGGHGQGASVVKIPQAYGELAVQLAVAFHNFLIGKHLERSPSSAPSTEESKALGLDDDIPF